MHHYFRRIPKALGFLCTLVLFSWNKLLRMFSTGLSCWILCEKIKILHFNFFVHQIGNNRIAVIRHILMQWARCRALESVFAFQKFFSIAAHTWSIHTACIWNESHLITAGDCIVASECWRMRKCFTHSGTWVLRSRLSSTQPYVIVQYAQSVQTHVIQITRNRNDCGGQFRFPFELRLNY